ncbi:response regulator transcription factor [Sulfurimonas sp.]|uniref:response regulator transcription factor n=1 Tax=Sulfurimonas sp. TaxID=2022749 RepID=UPI0025D56DC4|nr:response regulator transcription factor [Sulfurimonas sp.]
MKILLLEDNERLCNFIQTALIKESYDVDVFTDGEEALHSINNGYGCFVLDINVPSVDGITILKTIRMYHGEKPVIIISSNHELEKIQSSYEKGCSDYLKKPFHIYELIQKIKKLSSFDTKKLYFSDDYVYDLKTHHLTCKSGEIKLAKKEILFLELLAKDIYRIVTFEEIEEYVWRGEDTTFSNIYALAKRLRRKIPKDAIDIVKGVGYSINITTCDIKNLS